jgi:hypothetical protein
MMHWMDHVLVIGIKGRSGCTPRRFLEIRTKHGGFSRLDFIHHVHPLQTTSNAPQIGLSFFGCWAQGPAPREPSHPDSTAAAKRPHLSAPSLCTSRHLLITWLPSIRLDEPSHNFHCAHLHDGLSYRRTSTFDVGALDDRSPESKQPQMRNSSYLIA